MILPTAQSIIYEFQAHSLSLRTDGRTIPYLSLQTTCEDAMRAWVEGNIPVWASFLGGIGLIQVRFILLSLFTNI